VPNIFMKKKAVTRDEWELHMMPKLQATIRVNRHFSTTEIKRVKLGIRPESMDDRWFIFYERDRLYIHRSWTGYCTYVVHFNKAGRDYVACEIHANRNPKQYGVSDDSYDMQMVFWLIDFLLLGRDTEMPSEPRQN
jgi:hypothetical protein